VRSIVETCRVCGWHGEVVRHKPEQCARYVRMGQMYLTGMNSREIGREMNMPAWKVLHALKVARVKTRRPGGTNNPTGINGRLARTRADSVEASNSKSTKESGSVASVITRVA